MSRSHIGHGWESSLSPQSCDYVGPGVVRILLDLGVRRVCDVGAGNGALAAALCAGGLYVVGTEPDSVGVEIARKTYPDISFYNLGVEDDPAMILREEMEPFDAVVATEVVEHLYAPGLLPVLAGRLLREGGYLVVSTPYHGYLKNLALSLLGMWDRHHTPLWDGGHIKFWSRRSLSRLLDENGFETVAFHGVGRVPWLWKSMILVAVKLKE